MPVLTLRFGEPAAADAKLVGGKGVNLSRLAQANFPVPPGYVITTDAYSAFIAANKLAPKIEKLLGSIDYADAAQLEAVTEDIRRLISRAPLPEATAQAIVAAYQALGDNPFVAVRSSGTAEDLAGASFAGQHDTYLDIRGEDGLTDAVRRCWASLWTARAVAYRQRGGFRHAEVRIAVVIQKMIESEVSGVLFTANPMSAAVDEYVVNASWGLGEAIVAGIVTPDLFVLDRDDLRVRARTIGEKTVKIVRDPKRSHGTREEEVAPDDRARPCLNDDQLAELGALGARVTAYYEGFPQDIEWALADGRFFLLQSRDVTGVDLCWDEDLDNWQTIPKDDETIWTRSYSDETWTGAVTPLMFSFRSPNSQLNKIYFSDMWGIDWGGSRRTYKYHRSFVYYNSKTDYTSISDMIHPSMRRKELFDRLPPEWRKTILDEPFSWRKFFGIWLRTGMLEPGMLPWKIFKYSYAMQQRDAETAHGLPDAQLPLLSDAALKKYTRQRMDAEPEYFKSVLPTAFLHMPVAMAYIHYMVEKWCGDSDPTTVSTLLTGLPGHSITIIENHRLQEIARDISDSPLLTRLFAEHPGREFFDEVAKRPDTKAFAEKYRKFVADFGHRGHADRDVWFDRRAENPGLDYNSLIPMIGLDFSEAEAKAQAAIQRREDLTAEMMQRLKSQPFGDMKAMAFKMVQDWLLEHWIFRDDERAHADKITFSIKKAALEISRRLVERGVFERLDDVYFFSREELFDILDAGKHTRLTRAKLEARRRNHSQFRNGYLGPMYFKGNVPVDLEAPVVEDGNPNVLRGNGTSRGKFTGIARIIASQKDIGKVKKGEILITTATDPGWTPVFMVISGLVLETGGLLAHGSLISREYGIPAVQIANAMKRIPDGARITVNGDTGEVHIEEAA